MAGATSCLTNNALTISGPNHCASMADFFSDKWDKADPLPLTCHWGPGINGESHVSDIRWLTQFLDEAREEGARHPSIEGEAIDG